MKMVVVSRLRLIAAALSCGAACATAAAHGVPAPDIAKGVRVDVTVTEIHGNPPTATARRLTLSCDPPTGTLGFAARLCREIHRHAKAMLAPGKPRMNCLGTFNMPTVRVGVTTAAGDEWSFAGVPNCSWPGTSLGVYWAAARRDAHLLERLVPTLRCDEEPALHADPAPTASISACLRGLWTPRAARLITLAAAVQPLASLDPRRLFPRDPGARRCTIRVAGPSRTVAGTCGVYLKNNWSTPTVTFVESWPGGRHTWRVVVRDGHASFDGESGPPAPQLAR